MGSSNASMNGMTNMGCDTKPPLQFPLTQRRKRRVLFTQAQVCTSIYIYTRYAIYTEARYNNNNYAEIFFLTRFDFSCTRSTCSIGMSGDGKIVYPREKRFIRSAE